MTQAESGGRPQVSTRRLSGRSGLALTVAAAGGRGEVSWTARQFAYRAGELAPFWYTAGLTWHLWRGCGSTDGPPVRSFGTLAEAKEYVAREQEDGTP